MFSSARNVVVRLLGRGPGRCLDLGCGTGRAIPALAPAGWSVVGTDVSIDQLEAAREHAGDLAQLVRGDAHVLPFEDGEFDAVISVLTHTDLEVVP
ncbi:MAG: class I SAM-dependent methyltransferase [Gaiellaceae bacterium]